MKVVKQWRFEINFMGWNLFRWEQYEYEEDTPPEPDAKRLDDSWHQQMADDMDNIRELYKDHKRTGRLGA